MLFALECWRNSSFNIEGQDIEEASTWLLDLVSREKTDLIQTVATVLSGVWFARNKRVWEGRNVTPAVTMELSAKLIQEWVEANNCKSQSKSGQGDALLVEAEEVWQPPAAGCYKLNVDASLFNGERCFTFGLVMRDEKGQFTMGKNMKFAGEVSVMEAEAVGVCEAIKWVLGSGLLNVTIESDSQMVVHAIHAGEAYQSEVCHIIDEYKEMLQERADLSVYHVKKRANKAANLMARVSCLLNSCNFFISPPDLLLKKLSSEVSI